MSTQNNALKRSTDHAVDKIPLVKLPSGISRRESLSLGKIGRVVVVLAVLVVLLLALYTKQEEEQPLDHGTTDKETDHTTTTYSTIKPEETISDSTPLPAAEETVQTVSATPRPTPNVDAHTQSIKDTSSTTIRSDSNNDDPFDYLNQHEVVPVLKMPRSYPAYLWEQFNATKNELIQRLEREYGADTANSMFFQQPWQFVSPLNLSRDRMIRKMQLKLLQVQLQQEQQSNAKAPTFIWATGGHSAAAGHGNYFNESYTARLEQLVSPVFRSIGIHFVGRNYAMGGTSSGLEVGVCVDQIFGLDMDVLSWDYGMTDGNGVGIFENYVSHAAIHPIRPSVVVLNSGGRSGPARQAVMQHMEEHGMPVASLEDLSVVSLVRDVLPESFGKSEEELRAMGPLVRNMKCDGQIEVGDPYCGSERWSPLCPERKYKAKWHPGW